MRRRMLLAATGMAAATVSLGLSALQDPWIITKDGDGDKPLVDAVAGMGSMSSRALAVVLVEGGQVRTARWRCTDDTVFEVGSVSKPLTGLVLADAVGRGQVDLNAPISNYLDLAGTDAGAATVRAVATHTAGLPRGGHAPTGGQWWTGFSGPVSQLLADAREADLGQPTFSYSNMGGALIGQLTAKAAGMTYPELMTQRLFRPLDMSASGTQATTVLSPPGYRNGVPAPHLVLDGYAPMGALVSSAADMAKLLRGLIAGTAPGTAALNPQADYAPDRSEGLLWTLVTDPEPIVALHPGGTPGYAAYITVSRGLGRGVAVLANTSGFNVSTIGEQLMADPPH